MDGMIEILQQAIEGEISSLDKQLQNIFQKVGESMTEDNYESDRMPGQMSPINDKWEHLMHLLAIRKQRLYNAVNINKFFADCDEVDTFLLEALRLVSSEDVGQDEANVQSLLKKHDHFTRDLKNYSNIIDGLHAQASALGEKDREGPDVLKRLSSIDRRYKDLVELTKLRTGKYLNSVSFYNIFNEADGVEQWIEEKVKMIDSMVMSRDMEDMEGMLQKWKVFEQEMNANSTRMAVVNQLAWQMLHVEHPNSEEILARQNQLNQRWTSLREVAEHKKKEINSSHGVQIFHIECKEKITSTEEETKLLHAAQELRNDLAGIINLKERLSGTECDLVAIQAKLDSLKQEGETIQLRLKSLQDGWTELHQMWESRQQLLFQSLNLHISLRESKQDEMILNQEEHYLSMDLALRAMQEPATPPQDQPTDGVDGEKHPLAVSGEQEVSQRATTSSSPQESQSIPSILEVDEIAEDAAVAESWLQTRESKTKEDKVIPQDKIPKKYTSPIRLSSARFNLRPF